MTCTWGEIRDQVTRALVDDDYHEDLPSDVLNLEWKNNPSIPEKISRLLILEGKSSVEFADICLIDRKSSNSIEGCNLSLYELDNNLIVCSWPEPEIAATPDVMRLLEPWIEKAEEVICVKSLPLPFYQSDHNVTEDSLVRILRTDSFKANLRYQVLEEPNIITGAAAGAITLCNFKNKPGIIFVAYLSLTMSGLDSMNASLFTDLFSNLKINLPKSFVPKKKTTLNLYM